MTDFRDIHGFKLLIFHSHLNDRESLDTEIRNPNLTMLVGRPAKTLFQPRGAQLVSSTLNYVGQSPEPMKCFTNGKGQRNETQKCCEIGLWIKRIFDTCDLATWQSQNSQTSWARYPRIGSDSSCIGGYLEQNCESDIFTRICRLQSPSML
jgi:hypothetical protein